MTFTDNTPAAQAEHREKLKAAVARKQSQIPSPPPPSNPAPEDCFLPSRIGKRYLPARRVWERYGVSDMTLHRWLRDAQMGFPRPTYFGRFRYFEITDLEEWERRQAARRGGK